MFNFDTFSDFLFCFSFEIFDIFWVPDFLRDRQTGHGRIRALFKGFKFFEENCVFFWVKCDKVEMPLDLGIMINSFRFSGSVLSFGVIPRKLGKLRF